MARVQSLQQMFETLEQTVDRLRDLAEDASRATNDVKAAAEANVELPDRIRVALSSALHHQHRAISDDLAQLRQQHDRTEVTAQQAAAAVHATADLPQQITAAISAALDQHRQAIAELPQQVTAISAALDQHRQAIADLPQQVTAAVSAALDQQRQAIAGDLSGLRQQQDRTEAAVQQAAAVHAIADLPQHVAAALSAPLDRQHQAIADLPQQVAAALSAPLDQQHQAIVNDLARLRQQQDRTEAAAQQAAAAIEATADLPQQLVDAVTAALDDHHQSITHELALLRANVAVDVGRLLEPLQQDRDTTDESALIAHIDSRLQWLVRELSDRLILVGNEVVRINKQLSSGARSRSIRSEHSAL